MHVWLTLAGFVYKQDQNVVITEPAYALTLHDTGPSAVMVLNARLDKIVWDFHENYNSSEDFIPNNRRNLAAPRELTHCRPVTTPGFFVNIDSGSDLSLVQRQSITWTTQSRTVVIWDLRKNLQ